MASQNLTAAAPTLPALLEQVLITGDLSRLDPAARLAYYKAVCESVGLNPLTKPFDYLQLSGKLVLYAKKDATDQLRKIHGVSIVKLHREFIDGLCVITAEAEDQSNRSDSSLGVTSLENLRAEAKANAIMKAETKAKRRVTLSICGLGIMDESEIEDAAAAELDRPAARATVAAEAELGMAGDAPHVTPDEEERNTLIAEASRLSKVLKHTTTQKRALLQKHLGDPMANVFTADAAALQELVDELRQEAQAQGLS